MMLRQRFYCCFNMNQHTVAISVCKTPRRHGTPSDKNTISQKGDIEWVEMRQLNFVVGGTKFIEFVFSKVRGILLTN